MRISCIDCSDILPVIDKVELKLRYILQNDMEINPESYQSQLDVRFETMRSLFYNRGFKVLDTWSYGRRCFYVQELAVYAIEPTKSSARGKIKLLTPDKEVLGIVQDVIVEYAEIYLNVQNSKYKRYTLSKYVKLIKCEFAYDFQFADIPDFDECNELDLYDSLTLRLGARIYPIRAINTFAVAIVGKVKRCRDKAKNGNLTIYIQSSKNADRNKSSDLLSRNRNSAIHTRIYPKELIFGWVCRVEMTPNISKLNKLIKFDPLNLADILEQAKNPFSNFYEFRATEAEKLVRYISPKIDNIFAKKVKICAIRNCLRESQRLPVAEQVRLMSNIARRYEVHPQRKARLIGKLNFEEAINLPVPENFWISQRKGRRRMPIDILAICPDQEIFLQEYKHEPEPPARLTQKKLRPLTQDMAENRL